MYKAKLPVSSASWSPCEKAYRLLASTALGEGIRGAYLEHIATG
jgi:hypothetical protein